MSRPLEKSKFYDIFATRALNVKLKLRFFNEGEKYESLAGNVYNRRHTNTKACLKFYFPLKKYFLDIFLSRSLFLALIKKSEKIILGFFWHERDFFISFQWTERFILPILTTHSHTTYNSNVHKAHRKKIAHFFLSIIYLDLYKSPSSNSG